jgi:1-phosphatidylinositol-4-phosphate 5-kinase
MPMPDEGTAAADALAANAAKPVTRFNKIYKRSKRKPPTKTNIDSEEMIVPGKLITRENDMYVMSIGMMLGLRVSLMYNAAHVDEEITDEDMQAGDHYVFPPEGNLKPGYPATPKHHLSHTFKFKDYAPKVFHRLRLLMGVDTKRYMNSVSGNVNYVQFTSNSKRYVLI